MADHYLGYYIPSKEEQYTGCYQKHHIYAHAPQHASRKTHHCLDFFATFAMFWIRLNLLVIVDALAGLELTPSAYRRGRAVGFRRCRI